MNWTCDPVAIQSVSRSDLHKALWWGEGEHHGVSGVGSGKPRYVRLRGLRDTLLSTYRVLEDRQGRFGGSLEALLK